MIEITPAEYNYLCNPFWSDGGDMLKLTLQALCYNQFITVENRWILLNPKDTKKHKRVFLKLNPENKAVTKSLAEQFILNAFEPGKELRFYHIRAYVKSHFDKDTDRFKKEYVYRDLSTKELISLVIFPSAAGKYQRRMIKQKIAFIDSNIEHLIKNDRDTLLKELDALKSTIVLLDKKTITLLRTIEKDILDADALVFFSENYTTSFDSIDSFTAFDSFDSIGSFDFGDNSVDFGGGDFGGAGSDGHW